MPLRDRSRSPPVPIQHRAEAEAAPTPPKPCERQQRAVTGGHTPLPSQNLQPPWLHRRFPRPSPHRRTPPFPSPASQFAARLHSSAPAPPLHPLPPPYTAAAASILPRVGALLDGETDRRQHSSYNMLNNYPKKSDTRFRVPEPDGPDTKPTPKPMSSISSNEKHRYAIGDWQKGQLLGRGSFGTVYEGIADGGFFFAVKEVSLLDQGNEGKKCIIQLEQEIALLSQFKHKNIVRYYGTKKDDSHLYIFLELVTKGSLLSLYQRYELRGPIAGAYTRQILHGLKYLHDKDVIHRDIKCANILVHTNGLVKLADFGLAKVAKLNDVKSCKGTPLWMAPEVFSSKGYGPAADIWSLGCTVLEMLTRRFPYYECENVMAALYRIGKGERPEIPNTLSSDARNFILQCLQIDPSLRPTAAQLLDHPFVNRPLQCLQIDPSLRPTAAQLLDHPIVVRPKCGKQRGAGFKQHLKCGKQRGAGFNVVNNEYLLLTLCLMILIFIRKNSTLCSTQ